MAAFDSADEMLLDLKVNNPVHDNLEGFRRDGVACDFELRFGAGVPVIKAHQLVLLSRNEYFKRYLETQKNKKYLDCKAILKFPTSEMQVEVFELLIKYIYTGLLEVPQISAQKMKHIVQLSDILQIPEIRVECVKTVEAQICPGQAKNYRKLFSYVHGTCIFSLLVKFQEWLKENLNEIIDDIDIPNLTKSQLLDLVQGTDRGLESDSALLKLVFEWVSYDERKRSKDLRYIVAHLDLKLIYKENPKLLLNSPLENVPECHKVLLDLYKESAEELVILKQTLKEQNTCAPAPHVIIDIADLKPEEAPEAQARAPEPDNIMAAVTPIPAKATTAPTNAAASPIPIPSPAQATTAATTTAASPIPVSIPATAFQDSVAGPSQPRTDDLPFKKRPSPRESPTSPLEGVNETQNITEKRVSTGTGERVTKKRKVVKKPISIHAHLLEIKPEAASPTMQLLYVFKDSKEEFYFQVYDFFTNSTNILYKINDPRKWSNLLFRDGSIYYIGGIKESVEESSTEVQVFNAENPNGKQMLPLFNPSKAAAVCFLGDAIYVTGGETAKETHSCVQKLSLIHEANQVQFEKMNFLTHPRDCHGVFVIDDKIYAVGGFGKYNRSQPYAHPLKSMECYSPKMDCWEYLPQSGLNHVRGFCNVVKLGNAVYCLGGVATEWVDDRVPAVILKSAEVYNPETKKWTLIPDMNEERFGACAFGCHGLVYVFGGNRGKAPTAEFYDPDAKVWKYLVWPNGLPHPQKDDFNFFFSILLPSN